MYEAQMETENMLHISIDDFLLTFQELTDHEGRYASLFMQPVFGFLRRMHQAYGTGFSCYCFGEDLLSGFSLSDVTRKYRKEFRENAHWLKFGFHGMNRESVYGDNGGTRSINRNAAQAAEDYEYVTGQLVQIADKAAIDTTPRIHFYAGTAECCMAWKNAVYGIRGLLAADDDRYSYYHDERMRAKLLQEDVLYDEKMDLYFFKTHIRLEKENDLEILRKKVENFAGECQIIFTHEHYLEQKEMREKIELCARQAAKREEKRNA